MEEKVYARSVIKDGVAIQVVDGKFSEMRFKAEELKDLQESDIIVKCNACQKKRRLIDQDPPSADGGWFCSMNSDKRFNKCKTPQELGLNKTRRGPMPILNNPILEHVVGVINKRTKQTALVTDYLPVQITHASDLCCEDAIDKLKDEISGESQNVLSIKSKTDGYKKTLRQDNSAKKKNNKVFIEDPKKSICTDLPVFQVRIRKVVHPFRH